MVGSESPRVYGFVTASALVERFSIRLKRSWLMSPGVGFCAFRGTMLRESTYAVTPSSDLFPAPGVPQVIWALSGWSARFAVARIICPELRLGFRSGSPGPILWGS